MSILFVLCEPTHPGNIGAAARAIKTMGFTRLALVNPSAEHPDPAAVARASGACDVLESARVTTDLAEAVADCGLVIGASARHRRLGSIEIGPQECAEQLLAASGPVALVFGTERSGLSNAQLDLCNALVSIPANPDYSSLNLAAAVQLLAWELRKAQLALQERQLQEAFPPLATVEDMELFYDHLQRVLVASNFLDPANPRKLMRRLRRLFNRAHLDENELNIMRGILAALAPGSGERDWTGRPPAADR